MKVLYSCQDEAWKIADFGLTVEGSSKRANYTRYARGTDCYRAPELLQGSDATYTNKVDIWAAGCVLYEIVFQKKMFISDYSTERFAIQCSRSELKLELPETSEAIPDTEKWGVLSTMIDDMLTIDRNRRPSAELLLRRLRLNGSSATSTVNIIATVPDSPLNSTAPNSPNFDGETENLSELSPVSSAPTFIRRISNTSGGTDVTSQGEPSIIPPLEPKMKQLIRGWMRSGEISFEVKEYMRAEENFSKAYTELEIHLGSLFQGDERLEEMLVISQCKNGNLEAARTTVLKVLTRKSDFNTLTAEAMIFKLVDLLISTYCEKEMLEDASRALNACH